jgi:hypothetical protein
MTKESVYGALAWMGLGAYLLYLLGGYGAPIYSRSPRKKNGVDTIETKDSTYIIHFEINKAYKRKEDPEPPDDEN